MATRIEFSKHGGPEVLNAVEFTPNAPAENEVQVENKAIGINYIDTYIRSGLYPPPSMPSGLGTEAAGVVSQVGSNVKHIKAGDRVVYAQSGLGAYSSVHNVAADKVALLPSAISYEQAAASFLKGLTVFYLLRKTYEIKPGEPFLFHAAAGGVGLIACQWAKALGLQVIATAGSAEKCALALANGAAHAINYREENFAERVREITGGAGVKVVYDSVGKDTFEGSLASLMPFGLMVSFGNASGPVPPVAPLALAQAGCAYLTRQTLFTHLKQGRATVDAMAGDLFDVVRSGQVKIHIDQRFALEDVQQAHRALEARQTTGSSVLTL